MQASETTISDFFPLLQKSVQTMITDDVLTKISRLKGLKMAKKSGLLLFAKTLDTTQSLSYPPNCYIVTTFCAFSYSAASLTMDKIFMKPFKALKSVDL